MRSLKTGQFFGVTNETARLEGLTLTDTEYTHERVDWHYHENPYLTFILQGNVIEGNKKETYNCSPGTLLFHNWDDAHYNIKPPGYTRGFHIEMEKEWFGIFGISTDSLRGSMNISDPAIKLLMYGIFGESKLHGQGPSLAIDSLLTELFAKMVSNEVKTYTTVPAWVNRIREILHESDGDLKLSHLAHELGIHPVHLSRDFSRYFHCRLGDYIRNMRLQKAFALLPQSEYSLTEIAMQCNFADQSHFIRSFKAMYNTTPLAYRNILLKNRPR